MDKFPLKHSHKLPTIPQIDFKNRFEEIEIDCEMAKRLLQLLHSSYTTTMKVKQRKLLTLWQNLQENMIYCSPQSQTAMKSTGITQEL